MTHGSDLPRHERGTEATRSDAAPSPVGPLRVTVSQARPGVIVVAPAGELDVATADVLRGAAQSAVATATRGVVIDLGGLTFCGSTGLVVLLDTGRGAEAAGLRFGTVAGSAIVRRVLDITQLGPTLGHHETLDDALEALDLQA